MQWQEIREHYPQQWLLVEAIKAHSEANARVVEQLAVVESFSDSVTAMKGYAQLHREAPDRELYVFTPVVRHRIFANESGIDFLVKTNAVIDLAQMQLYEAIR